MGFGEVGALIITIPAPEFFCATLEGQVWATPSLAVPQPLQPMPVKPQGEQSVLSILYYS